jgi:hypothetical protein
MPLCWPPVNSGRHGHRDGRPSLAPVQPPGARDLTNYSGSMGELEPVDAGPGLGAPPGTAEKGASC